jgi:hypothetical protein
MENLDMSFKEKSIWASLLIMLLVYSKYFLYVFEGLAAGTLDKGDISGLFLGAVITLIIYHIVFHIILAIFNVKQAEEASDERDRMIANKAGNISGWVLGFAVLTIAAYIFIQDLDALWSANLLLLALVVSQLTSYVMQLFYYRRGY